MSSLKHKVGFGFLNLLFLGLSIAAGVTLVKQSQEIRSQAEATPSITMTAEPETAAIGDRILVSIELNATDLPVGFIDLELKFDPNEFQAIEIKPGTYYTTPNIGKLTYKNNIGTAYFSYRPGGDESLQSGDGLVGILVLRAERPGEAQLSLQKHKVALNADSPSIIDYVDKTTVSILDPSSSN